MAIVVIAAANTKPASEGPFDVLLLTLETFWWLWATIALLGLSKAVWRLYQWRRLARSGIGEIDAMDGQTFELFLVTLFKRLGYDAEHTGRARGDYGADLVVTAAGRRTVVQA
jgi:HJR/Mrr/RecB family endonuclease